MELLGSQKSYQLLFPGRYSFTLAQKIWKWPSGTKKNGRLEIFRIQWEIINIHQHTIGSIGRSATYAMSLCHPRGPSYRLAALRCAHQQGIAHKEMAVSVLKSLQVPGEYFGYGPLESVDFGISFRL